VKMFDADKNRMIGLSYGEKNCDDMLSRFHLVPERNGRTDILVISISRVSILTRDKNNVTGVLSWMFAYMTYRLFSFPLFRFLFFMLLFAVRCYA